MWRRLDLHRLLKMVPQDRRLELDVELLCRCMVVNRLVWPVSKLATTRWVGRDVVFPGLDEGLHVQNFYRAMDHLLPHSMGGGNDTANLVTCCHKCNSSRGNRDWREFAATVAAYLNHGIMADAIISHIEMTTTRPVNVAEAKAIIARRGGFTAALHG